MSNYSTIQGWIEYKDIKALTSALNILSEDGWIKPIVISNFFQFINSNPDHIIEFENANEEKIKGSIKGLKLKIPYSIYRNLSRNISYLLEGAKKFCVVGTTTDGDFYGWADIKIDKKHKSIEMNLDKFAKKKGIKIVKFNEEDLDGEYMGYQADIEDLFMETYYKE